MIIETTYSKDLIGSKDSSGNFIGGINISYYGDAALQAEVSLDIKNDIEKFLYKDCVTTHGYEGVIIGFDINNQFLDYYYIVYVPELNRVTYELCNDSQFISSIKI